MADWEIATTVVGGLLHDVIRTSIIDVRQIVAAGKDTRDVPKVIFLFARGC